MLNGWYLEWQLRYISTIYKIFQRVWCYMSVLPYTAILQLYRCRECKLSNAELVVFPCLEVACISVSFRHKQIITTSCARTTSFPLGRTNGLRCSSAPRHAVLLTAVLGMVKCCDLAYRELMKGNVHDVSRFPPTWCLRISNMCHL